MYFDFNNYFDNKEKDFRFFLIPTIMFDVTTFPNIRYFTVDLCFLFWNLSVLFEQKLSN